MEQTKAFGVAAMCGLAAQSLAIFGAGSTDGSEFKWVGKLLANGVGSGTVVSEYCVLTARHNVVNKEVGDISFDTGLGVRVPTKKIEHETSDMAMLVFAEAFGGWYAPSFDDATGHEIDVVGYGRSATIRDDYTGYDDDGFATNSVRRATRNAISKRVQYSGYMSYQFDYDSPHRETPVELQDRFADGGPVEREGGTRRGDSGGAYLRTIGGSLRLVGVHTAGLDLGGPGVGDSYNSDFGDASAGVALSDYQGWVEINTVPEPASVAALTLALSALVRRRSR